MLIKVDEFAGMSEAVTSRLLDSKFATKAVNCRVDRGALEPIRAPSVIRPLPIFANTIFRYSGDHWFTWGNDVDAVRATIPYDTTDRVYYTGHVYPRQTRNDIALGGTVLPNNSYRLGVPVPPAPSAQVVGDPDPDQEGLENTVYYVVTYVTAWGEEGPPSLPSNPVTITEGQAVNVGLPAMPSGNYNFFNDAAIKRIYRSNAGTGAGAFQFLAQTHRTADVYTDVVRSDMLGEVLPSSLWDGPPDDNLQRYASGQMRGLRSMANGTYVGFSGNTLVFSESYLGHAWPYSYPIKDKIVAIEVTSAGVLVATEDRPVIALGSSGQSMVIQELDERQACVSKRSMVDMGEYAIYASPDGLVGLENGSAQLLTKGLFRREVWQRFKPETIRAFKWEDKYVGFYKDGFTEGGFIFTPGDQKNAFIELSFYAQAGYYDGLTDALFMAQGNNLTKFDAGNVVPYTWRSKKFQLPRPAPMSVLQVIADTYPVSVKIIKDDGELTYSVPNDDPIRLATGRSHAWQFEVTGTNIVHSVALAQSVAEISNA